MVCYYYPPLTDVGCKRSVAFSKYFKKHGWAPYVLSVKNPDKAYCSVGKDAPPPGIPVSYAYSLINLYKPLGKLNGALSRLAGLFNITIKRNYFYDLFCVPDYFWGWIPLACIAGYRLIKKHAIDVIYVSCTPHSASLTGIILKRLSGKPLVVDFRDPFALEAVGAAMGTPRWRRKINGFIEKFIIHQTDIFVVNNEGTREAYLRQYPFIQDKIFAVHNGFETDGVTFEKKEKHAKFTIVYTGDFYWYAQQSAVFFEALALLKSEGKVNAGSFQFLFFGDGKDLIAGLAEENHISDLVAAHSRIPYREVLDVLARSHLQLLRIIDPMLSTKLFEGIPLNVPFLATISSREAEELIKRYSPGSYVVREKSPRKVADAILDATAKYKNGQIQDNQVREFLTRYSRESLTLRLMDIIERNARKSEVAHGSYECSRR